MTITYGIALSLDWEKPMWAGFAVAFVSLATVGLSLNKAALRLLGTLVAAGVALTIIALSPQQRWLFMLFLSSWVGFCTYMMGGSRYQYFWMMAGYVCALVSMESGPDAVNAFNIAVLRVKETGLGILVYSLAAILLWPRRSGPDFDAAARKLALTQRQLFQAYFDLFCGQRSGGEAQSIRTQEIQEMSAVAQLQAAAESDSDSVRTVRELWRRYQRLVKELSESLERWRGVFAEAQAVEVQKFLPNLATWRAEIDGRLEQIVHMLSNQAPKRRPVHVDIALAEAEARRLPPFGQATLLITQGRLRDLEALTQSLFATLSEIKGFGTAEAAREPPGPAGFKFGLDPDRMLSVFQTMVGMWGAYLAYIYVNDLAGGIGVVILAASWGMILFTAPQISVSLVFVPAGLSVLFAGALHILVMPHLSDFTELGFLIFAVTFSICYLFAAPQLILGRTCGLAIFVLLASVSNHQTYSFLRVVNTAIMFVLALMILAAVTHIPFSPQPQRAFLRLLGRFFRSAEYLLSAVDRHSQRSLTLFDRWKIDHHLNVVLSSPEKLRARVQFMKPSAIQGATMEQIQAVVSSLQDFTYRLQDMLRGQDQVQATFLVRELQDDLLAWCRKIERTFQQLSVDPTDVRHEMLQTGLVEIMNRMEVRIQQSLNLASEGQVSVREGADFCRLLGSYRGLSLATVAYAGAAARIDWSQWCEPRF